MEYQKKIIIGYNMFPSHPGLYNATDDGRLKYLSYKANPNDQLLLALIQYHKQYTKYVGRVSFVMTSEKDIHWPNGTLEGLVKKINYSEIDVGVVPAYMNEHSVAAAVDFSYPYKLEDYTFIIHKPVYKPHIFGIFQTFSFSVWLTIILFLIAMPIVNYTLLKRKYTFKNISFQVFAILMKQNSLIRPSSCVEKLLVYSWVVGAMLLCLSYDSVF